ncbi:Uncharacterised protein [Mycobacteroides abscessus subsp. abscessus]|uniref:Uncharacterized protein n=7 Tax=Mycobacteroides abscessus TaxID=36809 RepID=A0AB38CXN4_9MYCO|nr:hypothetical protein [Mycobacteroides abscessus]ESV62223.1 hypothetical protein L833_4627 [Mycobacteroides abscessus MAB_091912_2446]EUA48760.1 hypothetical protein I543_1301 [Mycobacteroides abscessus 21]EUA71978.1 hypothetical protein I540_1066 [Mycobacteroides abscessus subsp. bolletii 1513]AGM27749.1 hypothetical protein MASS_1147 [Mycobacteroides abscessus subsp. bolletii 50594]AMU25036.1 hypothetical protein A3N96_06030 [Mycobacteroides abscessus]
MTGSRVFVGVAAVLALGVVGAPTAAADNCSGPLTARVCVKPGNAELHSTPNRQFIPDVPQASPWLVVGGTGSGIWLP